MPSPFPGMDPYIEAFGPWRDFHHSFVIYIRNALQPLLRPKYRARVEERAIADPDGRGFYPDVSVVKEPAAAHGTSSVTAAEECDSPVVVRSHVPVPEPHQIFLQIVLPGPEAKVVTAIEVLSPSNKARGLARRKYALKQVEILTSDTNLVEIDLLLTGGHVAAVPVEEVKSAGALDYLVSVSRAADRTQFELYPIPLTQRLPRVAIPLLPGDKDVVFNLQTVFSQTYEDGAYADDLDYTQSLPLAISDEQAAQISDFLKQEGE